MKKSMNYVQSTMKDVWKRKKGNERNKVERKVGGSLVWILQG